MLVVSTPLWVADDTVYGCDTAYANINTTLGVLARIASNLTSIFLVYNSFILFTTVCQRCTIIGGACQYCQQSHNSFKYTVRSQRCTNIVPTLSCQCPISAQGERGGVIGVCLLISPSTTTNITTLNRVICFLNR